MTHLRLRKRLDAPIGAPAWPEGIAPVAFDTVEPRLIHALLDVTFPGLVAPFQHWHGNLTTSAEFHPSLCVPALAGDGSLAGFVNCWTSGFVKDLAVAQHHRGKGVGAALMQHAFMLFAARKTAFVDLEVEITEEPAHRLYARLGMVEV